MIIFCDFILQIDSYLHFYKLYLYRRKMRDNVHSATIEQRLIFCPAFVLAPFFVKNSYRFSVIIFCTTSAKRVMFPPLPPISPVRKIARM
jgi:hypothetical protein